ncbi:hypothetical protein GGX14DRAFT_377173 [Mycena pura]|uniref:DUF659 domain-containing protein n=1 Tax=Mycena pura TaxID=153505 RepID=A0AAD6UZ43_9AGAR|nr:hypothetical protein GGX14DRAFT_377173 [Mycena pura]
MGDGTLGYPEGWVVHILGGKSQSKSPCPNASQTAIQLARAADKRKPATDTTSASAGPSRKRAGSDAENAAVAKKAKKPMRQAELAVFKGIDLPFSDSQKDAIQAQCERVVVSCFLPEGFFKHPEVQRLHNMMRSRASEVLPSRRLIGGRLLTEAIERVDKKIVKSLENKNIGITGVCAVRPGQVTTLRLINTTAANKDGKSMATFFATVISEVEERYSCYVVYFVTDADGGSKKGRMILLTTRPDLFLPSCFGHQSNLIVVDYFKVSPFALEIAEELIALVNWINNHDKVRDIFDRAQQSVSADENQGRITVVTYIIANMTRWTTHATAFLRILRLKRSLTQAAILNETAIVNAQVGAAKSTEKVRLETEARAMIAQIVDRENRFWVGAETVAGDLEPICFGTNINQKDDVRPDQVLLALVGMYLHFADHPDEEIQKGMVKRLEKRWKDADQTMFLLALILNPFEGLSAFGPDAGFNAFNLVDLLLEVYRRTQNRPGNTDSIATRIKKENAIENAFFSLLASTGMYKNFREKKDAWIERRGKCPIQVWEHALSSANLGEQELRTLAILILEIVCNTAGAERLFSNLKIRFSDRRARTTIDKLEKKARVPTHIYWVNQRCSHLRKNHADASALLAVPRHSDLLDDQDDEDETERGRALVRVEKTWRVAMAKWVGERRAEAAEKDLEDDDSDTNQEEDEEESEMGESIPTRLPRVKKWPKMTLAKLFKGRAAPPPRPTRAEIEEQAERDAADDAADAEEDNIPDDGGIEIASDEEYMG